MAPDKNAILVASHDPQLADVRKALLENAGFIVHSAGDPAAVARTCAEHKIRLLMIGYSMPPSDKRRIWKAARENCNVPILELYRRGDPEILDQNVFHHEAMAPDDFLETVRQLISPIASAD